MFICKTWHKAKTKLMTKYNNMLILVTFQIAFEVAGSLTDVVVDTHRRKHLAYLMADQGALVNPESSRNLPKQVYILLA